MFFPRRTEWDQLPWRWPRITNKSEIFPFRRKFPFRMVTEARAYKFCFKLNGVFTGTRNENFYNSLPIVSTTVSVHGFINWCLVKVANHIFFCMRQVWKASHVEWEIFLCERLMNTSQKQYFYARWIRLFFENSRANSFSDHCVAIDAFISRTFRSLFQTHPWTPAYVLGKQVWALVL